MNNSEFLEKYQQLQYTIMYDLLKNLGFGSLAVGNTYESAFFNHVQTKNILNEQNLEIIETELERLNRKSAVYFEMSEDLETNIRLLEENNYKKLWEDSWMFHSGKNIDSDFDDIELIEDESRLEVFLETFDKCYQKDDPQNPYGELGSYIDVARKVWNFHKGTNRLQYFLVKNEEDKPVAVSTLTNFAGIGYISNVGSIRSVRGKGYGKKASLFSVQQSVKNGNIFHCLATEEGDYPNEFYKRIGFSTKFTAVGYVKE